MLKEECVVMVCRSVTAQECRDSVGAWEGVPSHIPGGRSEQREEGERATARNTQIEQVLTKNRNQVMELKVIYLVWLRLY